MGYSIAAVILILTVAQTVSILRSPEKLQALRKQLDGLEDLLPGNAREGNGFTAVSFSAGVCEELVYRGYMIAYFAAMLGMIRFVQGRHSTLWSRARRRAPLQSNL